MRQYHLLSAFLIVLLVVCFLFSPYSFFKIVPEAYASASTLIYADIVQGNMSCVRASSAVSYATCHDATSGGNLYHAGTLTTLNLGQYGTYGTYYIWRMMIPFNTTFLSGKTITGAVLMLNMSSKTTSGSEFYITIDNRSSSAYSGFPSNPLIKSDYDKNNYSASKTFGQIDTSTMSTTKIYYNLTLTTSGLGLINQNGMTYLLLRSDRDIDNISPNAPSSDKPEYVTFYTPQSLGGGTPILNIMYTSAPTVSSVSASPTSIGYTCNFSSYWDGHGSGLDYVDFTWNGTGSLESMVYDGWSGTPTTGCAFLTKTLPTFICTVAYKFRVNSSDGWGDSGWNYFNTTLPSPDYSLKENLNITDFSGNTTTPVTWVQAGSGLSFTASSDQWVSQSVTTTWCRWVNLTNMDSQDSNNWIRGYELRVYDSNTSSHVTPSSVYSVCGSSGNQVAGLFIDGNTSTFWQHQTIELHHIVLDLGAYYLVSSIDVYVVNAQAQSKFMCDVYVANPWATVGVSPWVNASGYSASYLVCRTDNAVVGNFTLANTGKQSLKDARLIGNVSLTNVNNKIMVEYLNGTVYQNINFTISHANTWTSCNISITNYWSNWDINRTQFRFRCVTSDASDVKLDHFYVQITYLNLTTVTQFFPASANTLNAFQHSTSSTSAMYCAYLDLNTRCYMIVAYDLLNLQWTQTYQIAYDANAGDGHWAPSISYLPNGSLIVLRGYGTPLKYRVSQYSIDTESNLTRIITNWNDEATCAAFSAVSYPEPIPFNDKLVVFVRGGIGVGPGYSILTYDGIFPWSGKRIVGFNGSGILWTYGHPQKVNNTIFYYFYRANETISTNVNWENIYLICSNDEGVTWQHWNGTTLATPIEGEQCKVLTSEDKTNIYTLWNDEQGCTNILYSHVNVPYCRPINNSLITLNIVRANCTIPNVSASWSNHTLTDENNQAIYGAGTALYDTELNTTVLWSVPSYVSGQPTYETKYARSNSTWYNFWRYYTYCGDGQPQYVSTYQHNVVTDATVPYTAFTQLILEREVCGYEQEYSDTFNATDTSNFWLFAFVATRTENVTHVVVRLNVTGSNEDDGSYRVYLYNSTENLLACTDGTSWWGEAGNQGTPPRDAWEGAPLNQSVLVQEGQLYWLGIYAMHDTFQLYYQNTSYSFPMYGSTTYATAMTAQASTLAPPTLGGKTYYNRTASMFLASGKLAFWGLWDKLAFATYYCNTTYVKQNVATNVGFFAKALDFRGVQVMSFAHNDSGVWITNTTNIGGASQGWYNYSMPVTLGEGDKIAWYYTVNNTLGNQTSTPIQYLKSETIKNFTDSIPVNLATAASRAITTIWNGLVDTTFSAAGSLQTTISLFITITIQVLVSMEKTIDFSIYGAASSTFSIDTIFQLVQRLDFCGSINPSFAISSLRDLAFSICRIINMLSSIVVYTPLAPVGGGVIVSTSYGIAIAAYILAICALGMALSRARHRRKGK